MVAKGYDKTKGSTKAEVGEIDTSSPFPSVKDAVSLFGEGAFSGSGEKPAVRKAKSHSAERVLAKETQLHLAEKELNKLKERFKNAETSKAQALLELDRSKRTIEDLTQKLKAINESRDSSIAAIESTKRQARQFSDANFAETDSILSNTDHEAPRSEYIAALAELDAAKQDLRKIRQEYNASVEIKNTTDEKSDEAQNASKTNTEKASELSKEIARVRDSIREVNLENARGKEEEILICADKDERKRSYKTKLGELEKKSLSLKRDFNPELVGDLEARLRQTLLEIEVLRNEMENTKSKDLDSLKTVALELDGAKEYLNKVAGEEKSLGRLVETLKIELDEIKKDHLGSKEKESETDSVAGNLHVKLRKAKSELEEAIEEVAKVRGVSDEMISTVRQLESESRDSKLEAEEMKKRTNELNLEAEATRAELEEAEKKLKVALKEAEEAKAAEARALEKIKKLSEKTESARASISESGARITISKDEFESLCRRVEVSEKLAEMRVEAAMAQVEAVRASENEAVARLEARSKEIEETRAATSAALRKAEMAEAAKKAVEGELRRWREREQKKAVEAASRILVENEKTSEVSPRNVYEIREKTKVLEKAKTTVVKKTLMPSLSSLFYKKKKSLIEGGSPSYLSGEKKTIW